MKKYSVGVDLGGTKILIGLVDKQSGNVLCHIKKVLWKAASSAPFILLEIEIASALGQMRHG